MNEKKPFVQWFFKGFWPYWLGAILLGILNIILTLVYRPMGITSNITNCGLHVWSALGGRPENLTEYFAVVGHDFFTKEAFYDEATILNLGIIFGVLLSVAMASELRFRKLKSGRQLFLGIIGGILMGYGARLALGCNIGALIGGIASQSLHGWIFALFSFLGCFTGCIILQRYVSRSKG